MSLIRIVADGNIPFLRGALEPYGEVIYLPAQEINNSILKTADCLIVRTRTKCNAELLEGTSVKLIVTATTGDDHIDKDYCRSKNISFANAAGCNSNSVVQYVAGALAWLYKRQPFQPEKMTLGIIGAGRIGSRVQNVCKILGFNILLNDPPRQVKEEGNEFISLDELLAESDIVTLHVPLILQGEYPTYHLADEDFFNKIKKGAIFINTARGAVTYTQALVSAMERNTLSAAIIDVWEQEPGVPVDVIKRMDISTPHIAGYSLDGKANGSAMVVNRISQFFNLDLHDWHPTDLPTPSEQIINISTDKGNTTDFLFDIIRHTYNIETDSKNLKSSPDQFEILRNTYPNRREFPAYSVLCPTLASEAISRIKSLGFNTINDQ